MDTQLNRTIDEMCRDLRNRFERTIIKGSFAVQDGAISWLEGELAEHLQSGQFFFIDGSAFNDGVWRYGEGALTNEAAWEGLLITMGIPRSFVALAEDIAAWRDKYEGAESNAMSPFTSESFGGYSYVKSSKNEGSGVAGSWRTVFGSHLNQWRKI